MYSIQGEGKDVNEEYQYEDNDILGTLKARLSQIDTEDQAVFVPNYTVGSSAISLRQYLEEDFKEHKGARTLLIPYNVGGNHWVGILIALNNDNQVIEVLVLDSLKNEEFSIEIIKIAVQEAEQVYPLLKEKIKFLKGWIQDDVTSCGPLTVENLILTIQHKPLPNSIITIEGLLSIRQIHIECFREIDASFFNRQKNNINRVASILQQAKWLQNEDNHFNFSELKNITQLISALQQLKNPLLQKEIVEMFSAETKTPKEHLDNIRKKLKDIRNRITPEEEHVFYNLIKVLFNLECPEAKNSDFSDHHFRIPHEAFELVANKVKDSEDDIKKIQKQIEADEKLAKILQQKWNSEDKHLSKRQHNPLTEVTPGIFTHQKFEELIKKGYSWSDLINELVLNKKDEKESEELMKQLVNFRDILDCDIYKKITENLFEKEHFTVIPESKGYPGKDNQGNAIYIFKSYILKVYRKPGNLSNLDTLPSKEPCEIEIKAPGSRTLTSDIDTTITVTGAEHLNLDEDPIDYLLNSKKFILLTSSEVDGFKRRYLDYNILIQNELIRAFGEYSRENFGTTSGMNRDSNVYSDGFLRSGNYGYSKFKEQIIINNETIPETSKKFYEFFKLYKHQCEQAAGLYLLKKALNQDEWKNWKSELIENFKKLSSSVGGIKKEFTDCAILDIQSVLTICEALDSYATFLLENKITLIFSSNYKINSPYKEQSKLKDDIEAYAMEELYVEHLARLADIHRQVSQTAVEINKCKIDLNNLNTARTINKKKLEGFQQKDVELYKEDIKHVEDKIASENTQYNQKKEELMEKLKLKAQLENKRQLYQVLSNLFANEAYINHSAPYHVVQGMQGGGNISLTKQIFMGSATQQIGFRLLHSRKQRKEKLAEEEIVYKNAKYGYRVANLMFRSKTNAYIKPYNNDEMEKSLRPNSMFQAIELLAILEVSGMSWNNWLTLEECYLANSEYKIVLATKQGNAPIKQKLKSAHELLFERYKYLEKITNEEKIIINNIPDDYFKNEEKLFLSLASKLMVASYASKMIKNKNLLWGYTSLELEKELINNSPQQIITLELDRLKKLYNVVPPLLPKATIPNMSNFDDEIKVLLDNPAYKEREEIELELAGYVPPFNCDPNKNPSSILSSDKDLPLLEKTVIESLEGREQVLLIKGGAGSGKTIFGYYLERFFNREFQNLDDPILIFISLPQLKNPVSNLIKDHFTQKFDSTTMAEKIINKLRTMPKVYFILDAYDEIPQFQENLKSAKNLYETNKLYLWKNAKFIFTARTDFLNKLSVELFDKPYKINFTPWGGLDKPNYNLFKEIQIALFNENQINRYIDEYVRINRNDPMFPLEWDSEEYKVKMKGLHLEELIRSPLLLKMTVQALPIIVAWHSAFKKNNPKEFIKITGRDIFLAYLKENLGRQEIKLLKGENKNKEIPKDIKAKFLWFLISLSEQMVRNKKSFVEYKFSEDKIDEGPVWAKPFFGNPYQKNKKLLSKLELIRNNLTCLLMYEKESWKFIHESFLGKINSIKVVELTKLESELRLKYKTEIKDREKLDKKVQEESLNEFAKILFSEAEGPYYLTGKNQRLFSANEPIEFNENMEQTMESSNVQNPNLPPPLITQFRQTQETQQRENTEQTSLPKQQSSKKK